MTKLVIGRLRWLLAQLRFAQLRRRPMVVLGGGGELVIAPGAAVDLGEFITVGPHFRLTVQGRLSIGRQAYFNRDFYLSARDSVTIGERVRCGERVSIHDESHHFEPWPVAEGDRQAYSTRPVIIGDRVWLGANVVVLPGAVIGHDTVIGANSVVRGEIPPGVLAAGVPAVVIRQLKTTDPAEDHSNTPS